MGESWAWGVGERELWVETGQTRNGEFEEGYHRKRWTKAIGERRREKDRECYKKLEIIERINRGMKGY